jgi:hypothetical protein
VIDHLGIILLSLYLVWRIWCDGREEDRSLTEEEKGRIIYQSWLRWQVNLILYWQERDKREGGVSRKKRRRNDHHPTEEAEA